MVVVMKKIEKYLCPPSVSVYVPPVVESARRYKCGQVQSAQEYIMYLDTDAHLSQPSSDIRIDVSVRRIAPILYIVHNCAVGPLRR